MGLTHRIYQQNQVIAGICLRAFDLGALEETTFSYGGTRRVGYEPRAMEESIRLGNQVLYMSDRQVGTVANKNLELIDHGASIEFRALVRPEDWPKSPVSSRMIVQPLETRTLFREGAEIDLVVRASCLGLILKPGDGSFLIPAVAQ